MNRKTILIVAGSVAGAGLVAGGVALAMHHPAASQQYVAASASELEIVQRGTQSYDVSFAVTDALAAAAGSLQVWLGDDPDSVQSAEEVDYTLDGDRVTLATTQLTPGDHFLRIEAGQQSAFATVTIPDMAPHVWMDEDVPTIEFDESSDSSWSSYVDPEGKSVYRSASDSFDDSAQPLAEDLAITETSYRVDGAEEALPYYYLVFTGHDGDSTFVSSPLFASATQGQLSVELDDDTGTPRYVISGFLAARQGDVERSLSLRVGNYDAADPSSTFVVDNSSDSADSGDFRFEVDATELEAGYNDLAVFLTEDGSSLEWSLDATGVDLSQRLVSGESVFGIRRAEALQLTRLDLPYEALDVDLVAGGDTALLEIGGTFTADAATVGYQLVVKESGGEQHVAVDRDATASGFAFTLDLAALERSAVWYDVEFLDPDSGDSTPISTLSVDDMSQWVRTGDRTYAFADYDGLLKVFFENVPFADVAVRLATVDGEPSLVATGDLVDVSADDAYLRLASGDDVLLDVPNTSTVSGRFRFVADLDELETEGTWYDVLFLVGSEDRTVDIPSSAADLDDTLTAHHRVFGLRDWDDQLKVTFDAVPGTVDVVSASIVDSDGVPTLLVTGTLDRVSAADVYLRVRSGDEVYDVANSADADSGRARFALDLSQLTVRDAWYDVLVGVTSEGTLTDLSTDVADLGQSLTVGARLYAFHEWDEQLKVAFGAAPVLLTPTSATIGAVAGVPTLTVTGGYSGTTGDDLFLRIRTSAQTVDVANTATAAGVFAFSYDLSQLTEAGVWYDLLVGVTSTGQLEDLDQGVADLSQSLALGGRSYGFEQYDGDLKVTFTATPVVTSVTAATIADVDGVPTLTVTGGYSGTTGDDLFLRIRTSAQTVDVANTATADGQLLFRYDLSQLTEADVWYDLLVGVTSTGQLEDLDQGVADLDGTLETGGRSYAFHEWDGDLKVAFSDVAVAVTATAAEIVDVDGVATLRVTGTVSGTGNDDVYLRVRSGSEVYDVADTATDSGTALFEFDAAQLSTAGTWYDLLVGVTSTSELTDLPSDIADLDTSVTASGRAYGFHEWDGALKISFDDVTIDQEIVSAELLDLDGVPTLRVTGTVTGTSNSDVFLRVRTGSWTLDTGNTATDTSAVLYDVDLSQLTEAGTWYDLLAGVTSSGGLTDLSTAVVSDMSQSVAADDRSYSFQEWSGALKVTFADTTPAATVTSAAITDEDGAPVLGIDGTIANTTADDVYLEIATSAQTIDVANSSTDDSVLRFDYDLSQLTEAGTWYDLLIGITSTGETAEIATSVADLDTSLTIDARSYAFQSWYDVLKISYEDVTLGEGESLLLDIGPTGGSNGNATTSPDTNGNTWNNLGWDDTSGNTVTNGYSQSLLTTTGGTETSTAVSLTSSNWLSNGINTGGLLAPDPSLLGELAVATATQDFFFVQSSGTAMLTVSGLDPDRLYDLSFFGTRSATDTRQTTYTVTGSTEAQSALLTTSGTGIGTGSYNGNNDTIATISAVQPTTDGELSVTVTATTGGYGYLGILQITGGEAVEQVPSELSRWVSQDDADPLASDSVLFVGSSSIRRWETLTQDFADYNVIQRGWGGAWFTGVNDYAPWVVWPYQPKAIVMWAGTNDLNGGQSAASVLAEYQEFVGNLQSYLPDTDYFWISITPTPGNSALDDVRHETNALIKAQVDADATGKLHYIDIATDLEQIRDSDPELFTSLYVDDLHLSRTGYATWLSYVRPALEATVAPNKSYAANADTLQDGEKLLFDFGTSDTTSGDATTGADANGNHWNNWVDTGGGGLVNVGEHITGLVDSTGRDTGIGMTISGGFQANGKQTGYVSSPSSALLGDLAVGTATEDYFYSSADGIWGGGSDDVPGGIMMTGLDPDQSYTFHFFGSRAATETRITEYAVYGATSGSAELQTSGTGISADGTGDANDSSIAVISDIQPDEYGQVWIDLTLIEGSYTHLNAMEVYAGSDSSDDSSSDDSSSSDSSSDDGDSEGDSDSSSVAALGEGETALVDFGPGNTTNGVATTSPDGNGNTWNNVTATTANSAPFSVSDGQSVAELLTSDGTETSTAVSLTSGNWLANGGSGYGGLFSPSSSLLGELAVESATEDYYFVQSSGTATLTVSGLDPDRLYDLSFFGTRSATDTRQTTYTVTGSTEAQSALLTTSGTGIGTGSYNGNNDTIATISAVQPTTDGELSVTVTATTGGYGYLGILQITGGSEASGASGAGSAVLSLGDPTGATLLLVVSAAAIVRRPALRLR
ncbi:MAG: GDSL-type esterase/lipase family protein, partial [Microbacteriaceae bacterium]